MVYPCRTFLSMGIVRDFYRISEIIDAMTVLTDFPFTISCLIRQRGRMLLAMTEADKLMSRMINTLCHFTTLLTI